MELLKYQEIQENYKQNLLLGNGLSISLDSSFSYPSLFNVCLGIENDKNEKLLSEDDKYFFEQFETYDFEKIMRSLNTSRVVNGILQLPLEAIEKKYEHIKNALIHAVKAVHPYSYQFEQSKFLMLNQKFEGYKAIFSTNYDLVLYWSVMENNTPFIDFFFDGTRFNSFDAVPYRRKIPFYYLHGSLHLYHEDGITKKLIANGRNILDRLDETMSIGRTPLFVSEGTYAQKLQSISSNDYLNFCYYNLKGMENNLTIFGHSLNEEHDMHIINGINQSKVESIAYGIFVGDEPNVRQIEFDCARIRRFFRHKEVTFFDSITFWD